ncbi:uncharacterized protein PAC_06368 [Phialocephala subalpina]|uniref:J domain-containing protein n=1 Tax=Phialocephala subalpina TaxID=576137 RepID=A0A1L7WUR0_9HELO|nr:uncharacterized protein PAC_06368 [Phialocephala subalpina]
MTKSRGTKPHLSGRPRPKAPPKKEKPAPFRPDISPQEVERRSKLSDKAKSNEAWEVADNEQIWLEQNWWTGEKYNPLAWSKPLSDSTPGESLLVDDPDVYHSFFRAHGEESSDDDDDATQQEESTSSASSTPPKSQTQTESSGSAKAFFHGAGQSRPNPRNAYKAARKAERRIRKSAAQQDAEEFFRKRREKRAEAHDRAMVDEPKDTTKYWQNFKRSQRKDQEKYSVYYLALSTSLVAFKTDPNSNNFPKPHGFRCRGKDCLKVDNIKCCHHDLEKVLRGSGEFSGKWLKKERLQWHPDKFPGPGARMEHARVCSTEIFSLCERLLQGN